MRYNCKKPQHALFEVGREQLPKENIKKKQGIGASTTTRFVI